MVIIKVDILRRGDVNLLQLKNNNQEKKRMQLNHHLEIKEVVTELEDNIQENFNILLKVILAFQSEGVSLNYYNSAILPFI